MKRTSWNWMENIFKIFFLFLFGFVHTNKLKVTWTYERGFAFFFFLRSIINMLRILVYSFFMFCYGVKNENEMLSQSPDIVDVWPKTNFFPIPLVRQATDYTCGVASMMSVVCYWTGEDLEESVVANEVNSTETHGTLVAHMISFAQKKGFDVEKRLDMNLNELFSFIDKKIPVIVLIQAWPQPLLIVNWTLDYSDGHWVVACGYDAQRIFFMDPWYLLFSVYWN
jgi:predicted double-glycine peptidase